MSDISHTEAVSRLTFLSNHVNQAQAAVRMALDPRFSAETRKSSLVMLQSILSDMDREIVFPEQTYSDITALEEDAAFINSLSQRPE